MARPKRGELIGPGETMDTLARKFRNAPKTLAVINKVVATANTLGNTSKYQEEANEILEEMIEFRKEKKPILKKLIHAYLDLCIKSGGDPKGEHKSASMCAKMVMDRTIPPIKVVEIKPPSNVPPGVILMPTKKPLGAPIEIDAEYEVVDVKTVGNALDNNGKDDKPKKNPKPKTLKKNLKDPARG